MPFGGGSDCGRENERLRETDVRTLRASTRISKTGRRQWALDTDRHRPSGADPADKQETGEIRGRRSRKRGHPETGDPKRVLAIISSSCYFWCVLSGVEWAWLAPEQVLLPFGGVWFLDWWQYFTPAAPGLWCPLLIETTHFTANPSTLRGPP